MIWLRRLGIALLVGSALSVMVGYGVAYLVAYFIGQVCQWIAGWFS